MTEMAGVAAPSSEPFTSEGEYRAAIDAVIVTAQRELCIFDRDLFRMQLEDKGRAALLEQFLLGGLAGNERRVRVVVREPSRLASSSPRLQALLRRFPQTLSFHQAPENLAHLADCLVLADGTHAAIRFHADHARGKRVMNDPEEVEPRMARFEAIWEVSEPCLWAAHTGL
jgi:hypothetical protein